MLAVDNHGGIAALVTPSVGLFAGAGLSANIQGQFTTAETVMDLKGQSVSTGGTIGEVVMVGAEEIQACRTGDPDPACGHIR